MLLFPFLIYTFNISSPINPKYGNRTFLSKQHFRNPRRWWHETNQLDLRTGCQFQSLLIGPSTSSSLFIVAIKKHVHRPIPKLPITFMTYFGMLFRLVMNTIEFNSGFLTLKMLIINSYMVRLFD